MKKTLSHKALVIFLVYVLAVFLAAAGAYAKGIVFRQYLKAAAQAILAAGLVAVLFIRMKEIPPDMKRKHAAAKISVIAVIIIILLAFALQIFMGIDKESVIQKDGEKQIEVERSWIMFLERSYYGYKNVFWYEKNPHYTENYDDGDPDQFIYTDFYDENGNFTKRIYTE